MLGTLPGTNRIEVQPKCQLELLVQVPRRRFSSRQRTSRYMGVGSSNRKNQWQARILVHGKVTHLGYYETEEDAAKVYDRVSISLHGEAAQTNFPQGQYQGQDCREYSGLDREDLQRALGVKPMDKSSKYSLLPFPLLQSTPTPCSTLPPNPASWPPLKPSADVSSWTKTPVHPPSTEALVLLGLCTVPLHSVLCICLLWQQTWYMPALPCCETSLHLL